MMGRAHIFKDIKRQEFNTERFKMFLKHQRVLEKDVNTEQNLFFEHGELTLGCKYVFLLLCFCITYNLQLRHYNVFIFY